MVPMRPQMWLVVYYRETDSVRLEVSLPAGVDSNGKSLAGITDLCWMKLI